MRRHVTIVALVNLLHSIAGLLAALGLLVGGVFAAFISFDPFAFLVGTVLSVVAAGVIGLASALALVGLMWTASLKPADAAGPMAAPQITATAEARGHLGVTPLRLDGSVLAQTGVLATGTSVCRLVIDPVAADPLPATCGPTAAVIQLPLEDSSTMAPMMAPIMD